MVSGSFALFALATVTNVEFMQLQLRGEPKNIKGIEPHHIRHSNGCTCKR